MPITGFDMVLTHEFDVLELHFLRPFAFYSRFKLFQVWYKELIKYDDWERCKHAECRHFLAIGCGHFVLSV